VDSAQTTVYGVAEPQKQQALEKTVDKPRSSYSIKTILFKLFKIFSPSCSIHQLPTINLKTRVDFGVKFVLKA
jgi:peroxiredoxin